jgi:hypothetical protein
LDALRVHDCGSYGFIVGNLDRELERHDPALVGSAEFSRR